jgi:protein O-GlcNAc transferase
VRSVRELGPFYECTEAYGNLGNALKELGDLDGAVQFYLKVLAVRWHSFLRVSCAYRVSASHSPVQAIKLKPRFCDAYNNLASVHMQTGNVKQAIDTYKMAIVLNPSLVDAHSNLGNLFKAQGNLEEAKRCYMEAIRVRPDFAIAWSNLAGMSVVPLRAVSAALSTGHLVCSFAAR